MPPVPPHEDYSRSSDDARRREDASIRMEQRFEDFVKVYTDDKNESKAWRKKTDERLIPLEDLRRAITRPAQLVGAILLLMVTPILGILGWTIMRKVLEWSVTVLNQKVP